MSDYNKVDIGLFTNFFDSSSVSKSRSKLEGLFQRSIEGFHQRNVACTIEVQKNGNKWLHFSKSTPSLPGCCAFPK